jgi:prepilin-type N-terminal cleavage/methylation domain-containing protein
VDVTTGRSRGFTLTEVMVVLAIAAVLATLAVATFNQQSPRSRLDSSALEMRALLFGARQEALASGHRVAVMVFPSYDPGGWTTGVGRVVVYSDPAESLFAGAFEAFDPDSPSAAAPAEVLEVVDLPRSVRLAVGGDMRALPDPLGGLLVSACDFCSGGRGAIAFDAKGRATFHARNGPAFAVESAEMPDERRALVVLSRTGGVQTLALHP